MIIKGIARGAAIAAGTAIAGYTTVKSVKYINPLLGKTIGQNKYAKIDIKNFFTNIGSVMYGLSRYYFGNPSEIQPSCILGGVPMPSINELSHAMSDRILKFRATGGIFLAQQSGGDQTLRIQGKAFGVNRYAFLTMLDFLFLL